MNTVSTGTEALIDRLNLDLVAVVEPAMIYYPSLTFVTPAAVLRGER